LPGQKLAIAEAKGARAVQVSQGGGSDAVAFYDGVTIQVQGLQSRFWDWLAFWALAVAILVQLAVRVLAAVTAVAASAAAGAADVAKTMFKVRLIPLPRREGRPASSKA
jgi:hypothetical protein